MSKSFIEKKEAKSKILYLPLSFSLIQNAVFGDVEFSLARPSTHWLFQLSYTRQPGRPTSHSTDQRPKGACAVHHRMAAQQKRPRKHRNNKNKAMTPTKSTTATKERDASQGNASSWCWALCRCCFLIVVVVVAQQKRQEEEQEQQQQSNDTSKSTTTRTHHHIRQGNALSWCWVLCWCCTPAHGQAVSGIVLRPQRYSCLLYTSPSPRD